LKLLNKSRKSFKIESSVSLSEFDTITGFENFVDCYESNTPANIKENWNRFKVVVDQNMRVVVFSGDTGVDHRELDWILPNSKLEQWSQLHRILEYYKAKPAIMEKSNSFHFIKQALESLNKATDNRDIVDPIKGLLELALIRVDPGPDLGAANLDIGFPFPSPEIGFATVKLEPEDNYEQEFSNIVFETPVDQSGVKKDFSTNDHEILGEPSDMVEVKQELEFLEDEDMMLNEKPPDFLSQPEDESDKESPKPAKVQKPKKKREPRKPKEKIQILMDCPHCDRKQMTKVQYKDHIYSRHVSFALLSLNL
jgi:hypothetical protein